MKRRILSFLLAACLMLSLVPADAVASLRDIREMSPAEREELLENPFKDVKETDWFFDAVQYVRINGIFNGVSATRFGPNDGLTRGMFVTVLGRMAGVDASAYRGETIFTDVVPTAYYAP